MGWSRYGCRLPTGEPVRQVAGPVIVPPVVRFIDPSHAAAGPEFQTGRSISRSTALK